jgi:hypothetical protein
MGVLGMLDETVETPSWGTRPGELKADTGTTWMSSSRLSKLEQGSLPSLCEQNLYMEDCAPVWTLRFVIYRHILRELLWRFWVGGGFGVGIRMGISPRQKAKSWDDSYRIVWVMNDGFELMSKE